MRRFASMTDFRFLDKVVLEQIETANAIISQQNRRIYFVCFQTGILQVDLSGPLLKPSKILSDAPPLDSQLRLIPPHSVLLKIK